MTRNIDTWLSQARASWTRVSPALYGTSPLPMMMAETYTARKPLPSITVGNAKARKATPMSMTA